MKIKNGLNLVNIAGNNIVDTLGSDLVDLNVMISLNDVAAFIFEALKEETTKEEIIKKVMKEYDISEETATKDVTEFLENLKANSMLEE